MMCGGDYVQSMSYVKDRCLLLALLVVDGGRDGDVGPV